MFFLQKLQNNSYPKASNSQESDSEVRLLSTMAPPGMKTLVILLFLVCSFSWTNGYQEPTNLIDPHFKVRKLASLDVILDYHEATPNPAHDPGKGRPVAKSANNP